MTTAYELIIEWANSIEMANGEWHFLDRNEESDKDLFYIIKAIETNFPQFCYPKGTIEIHTSDDKRVFCGVPVSVMIKSDISINKRSERIKIFSNDVKRAKSMLLINAALVWIKNRERKEFTNGNL